MAPGPDSFEVFSFVSAPSFFSPVLTFGFSLVAFAFLVRCQLEREWVNGRFPSNGWLFRRMPFLPILMISLVFSLAVRYDDGVVKFGDILLGRWVAHVLLTRYILC